VGPGGKLEPGESPADAVVREVDEEVGIKAAAESLVLIGELTIVHSGVLGIPLSRLDQYSSRVRRTATGMASAERASP